MWQSLTTDQARRRMVFAALAASVLAMFVVFGWNGYSSRAQGRARPCEVMRFEDANFTVCTFDSRLDDLRLVWTGKDGAALRRFDALADDLGKDAERVRFAMNAGMFNDEGAPIGLYIENGKERHAINTADGPGNFHMKPNGIFSLDADGSVHVDMTGPYLARNPSPLWATQSGPMLVMGGTLHPEIQEDGSSRYVRNGVGRFDDHTAYFAISSSPVSFGKFARLFRDKLKCADALFFDGSVSSLWAPALKREDDGHEIGPIVLVSARP